MARSGPSRAAGRILLGAAGEDGDEAGVGADVLGDGEGAEGRVERIEGAIEMALAVAQCLTWAVALDGGARADVGICATNMPRASGMGALGTTQSRISRSWGNAWALGKSSLLAEVPSIVVPEEPNLLLNPAHGDIGQITAIKLRRWTYGVRLG
jgi:RES domain-containing protein